MTTTRWKVVRAFENNAPDYFLVFEGNKTFGADPVARCDNEQRASQIVREHNAHAAMVEALESAQTTLVSIKDFIGDMTDSHIRTGKRIPAASILQQVMDMAENQALETQAALRLVKGE